MFILSVLTAGTAFAGALVALFYSYPTVMRVAGRLARLSGRRGLAALSVGLIAGLLSAAVAAQRLPLPCLHDEFSYLLAADTFARGRLSNPTHPMWRHFETIHVIQGPTYASKYPPGQGLFLAAGQALTGRPIAGVCLSMALAAAALCWMLQGWMSPAWAVLGAMLAVFHRGIQFEWTQSYWGGDVCLLGGALLYGALPRLLRRPKAMDGLWLGTGLALLGLTRPYEGLAAALPALAVLGLRAARAESAGRRALLRAAAPGAALVCLAGAWLAYYDWRVTGRPLQMPYEVHERTYSAAPVFVWSPARPEPEYRQRTLRRFQSDWELGRYLEQRTLAGWLRSKRAAISNMLNFALAPGLVLPFALLPLSLRRPRWRFAAAAIAFSLAASAQPKVLFPHYFAPTMPLLFAAAAQGLRRMSRWRPGANAVGPLLAWGVVLSQLFYFGLTAAYHATWLTSPIEPDWFTAGAPFGWWRHKIQRELEGGEGRHLVFVRYSRHHNYHNEWVYNEADIDAAKVVWAHELGPVEDRRLREYFSGRKAWVALVDRDRPQLLPYPGLPPLSGPPPAGGLPMSPR